MIFFGIFMAVIIFSISPCKKEEGSLPRNRTNAMRGIMALSIVFHHMATWQGDSMLDSVVLLVFISLVGPFYFLSAYGLARGYLCKKDYMSHFFKKRFLKVLFPFLIMCVMQSVLFWCIQGRIDIAYIKSAADYWFVHSILIMYIGFRGAYQGGRHRQIKIVFFLILYVILCKVFGVSAVYYGDVLAFGFGIVYAENENKIEKFFLRHYRALTWTSVGISLLCYTYIHVILPNRRILPGLGMLAWFIQSISYCMVWLSLIYRTEYKNKIFDFLGDISYEIYLVQGTVFLIMDSLTIENKIIAYPLIIILCILFAWLLHKGSIWGLRVGRKNDCMGENK